MWAVFAILSVIFVAVTSILAKIGIEGVDSNLATAIRTVVVVAFAWAMVFFTNTQSGITDISKKSWIFSYEKFTPKSIIGCVLISAGTLLMVL